MISLIFKSLHLQTNLIGERNAAAECLMGLFLVCFFSGSVFYCLVLLLWLQLQFLSIRHVTPTSDPERTVSVADWPKSTIVICISHFICSELYLEINPVKNG